jgi:hypothetical protein
MVAIQKATRAAIRASLMVEAIAKFDGSGFELAHEGVTDSSAALHAVHNGGNGSALAHMPRTAAVSVAWLADYYTKENKASLVHQTGKDFVPDFLTKVLDQVLTEKYTSEVGVVDAGRQFGKEFSSDPTGDGPNEDEPNRSHCVAQGEGNDPLDRGGVQNGVESPPKGVPFPEEPSLGVRSQRGKRKKRDKAERKIARRRALATAPPVMP